MNQIHPTAIIEGDVQLGKGNEILPYTILRGPLKLGDNNIIGPHVVIGCPGADTRNPRYDSSRSPIEIGKGNIIREFSAIQKPAHNDLTRVCDKVFLMQNASVSHDAILEDDVVFAAHAAVAGLARIMKGAYLAMGCTVAQYSVIGPYAIVATGAAAVRNVRPFSRYIPGKPLSVNVYQIKKLGLEALTEEISQYVLKGVQPKSDVILSLTEGYERLHKDSGRAQYF